MSTKIMNQVETSAGQPDSPKAGGKRRLWIWVFVALAVLGLLAIGINFGYNAQQQLTEADLHQARQRWEKLGPRDYDLRVQIRRHSAVAGDPVVVDNFALQVRSGKVTSAKMNNDALEPRLQAEFDMPGLYDSIEEFLRRDRRPGQPQTFLKGTFDRKDGRLLKFIRRVRGSNERQEIVAVVEKV